MRRIAMLGAIVMAAILAQAQSQIQTNRGITDVEKPAPVIGPKAGGILGRYTVLDCDRNDVLLDVLKSITDEKSVKNEIEYETKEGLKADGVYAHRLEVIKTLAGKK